MIMTLSQNVNFQIGLLHLAYLLVHQDGAVEDRETAALNEIVEEENIPTMMVEDFQDNVIHKTEKQIYQDGIDFLNLCTEEEKLCAFVHLYRLSEADDIFHEKELRFLLYAIEGSQIQFEDVVIASQLANSRV
jgi:hypothetical protein